MTKGTERLLEFRKLLETSEGSKSATGQAASLKGKKDLSIDLSEEIETGVRSSYMNSIGYKRKHPHQQISGQFAKNIFQQPIEHCREKALLPSSTRKPRRFPS